MSYGSDHEGLSAAGNHASCHTCASRCGSAWASLSHEALRILNGAKEARPYAAGQVVFHEATRLGGVYCVQAGTVALRKEDACGNAIIVTLAGAGALLGHAEFFCGSPAWTTACAVTPCRICYVGGETVQHLTEHCPEALLCVLRDVGGGLASAEGELLRQAVMPVRARVAALLLTLRERHGTVDGAGRLVISLPVNRTDLAALLRARRETVSRALRQLDDAGVVAFRGRHAIVPDLDALMDEVKDYTGL